MSASNSQRQVVSGYQESLTRRVLIILLEFYFLLWIPIRAPSLAGVPSFAVANRMLRLANQSGDTEKNCLNSGFPAGVDPPQV